MDPAKVRDMVIEKAAQLAGVPASEITDATSLESLGLDSADAVVMALEVEQATGRQIDVGLFLRCETVADAAVEIANVVAEGPANSEAATVPGS